MSAQLFSSYSLLVPDDCRLSASIYRLIIRDYSSAFISRLRLVLIDAGREHMDSYGYFFLLFKCGHLMLTRCLVAIVGG